MGYLWVKTLHIISIISWMAGLLYLFRLFVYHAQETSSEVMARFEVMERRLLRAITTPAMVATLASGGVMLIMQPKLLAQPFMQAKLLLVLGMTGMHGAASAWRKRLVAEPHFRSHRFFRLMNEVPTLLLVGIVILIIVRPSC